MFEPATVVTGRPARLTLGLRPLDLRSWLDVDSHRNAELAEKEQLLAQRHSDVVATLPGSEPAAAELLTLLVDQLRRHHPRLDRMPDDRVHPVDAAGRLVQEDLCLLERGADGWRLTAASVCFPSRWRLADKIGRSVRDIHGPVPGYGQIAAPVDVFFDRLTTDRPMWRTNWSLLDRPDLFQPDSGSRRSVATADVADHDPDSWTFRVERQTLRLLPDTGAVAFTIRTYRTALAELIAGQPKRAADLAATLAGVAPETAAYKGWTRALSVLVPWLAERGVPPPAAPGLRSGA